MAKPSFFIVGAPRSGTTAMYSYLKCHPEIYLPPYNKEPHFFAKDLHKYNFRKKKGWITEYGQYIKLFDRAETTQISGEASALYLFSTQAAKEIYSFDPEAKIIIMLRNPLEMVYSWYFLQRSSFIENEKSFQKAFFKEQSGDYTNLKQSYKTGIRASYHEIALYFKQVKRYFDTFPRNQILIILFDEFLINTEIIYKETLRFLHVEGSYQPLFKKINKSKMKRNRLIKSLLDARPPFFIDVFRKLIPKIFRHRIYIFFDKLNTKYIIRPKLKPDFEQELIEYYRNDIIALGSLINKELSNWLKPMSTNR